MSAAPQALREQGRWTPRAAERLGPHVWGRHVG